MRKLLFSITMCLMAVLSASAAITEQSGWYEAAYVKWTAVAGATDYNVYVKQMGGSYTKLDKELVRKYPSYFRADAVGLKAGNYQMKVVPVVSGSENAAAAMESEELTVVAHDRNGFAHYNRTEGVGAYNNDGTLKANARILYVTANNAKTVSLDMQVDSKGKMETRTGLQNIIQAYEKGQEKRPIAVRIIGTIKNTDMDAFGSSAEGLQVKGNGSSKCIANLTIEGIGSDATIHGFGILCRSISCVEFRNFAVMICLDDCLSLDTDNKNVWIHNMDFFYGGTGSAADQAKGDGTVDIKGQSSHVTVSYNHFYDSGKCSLGGMKSETTDCWMTYHHNWFDHSDSRHPRIRTAFYHVYNNYFDGNAKYGVGVTCGGSAFVENNFFRNCKYPMLISKQGTDAQGDGTFSGETGGVIKAFNNYIANPKQILYYDGKQTDGAWDAVKVNSREENVSVTAFSGGTAYNSTATAEAIKAVPASAIDPAENVQAKVRDAQLGAGRMNGGDFVWKFNNAIEDPNYAVITEMKSALLSYKSTLVGFADGTTLNNGGATAEFLGGNGVGINQELNDKVIPTWGASGDGPEEEDFEEDPYIASADNDIFWFGENASETQKFIDNGTITMSNGSVEGASSKYDKDFYTTTTTGGVTYTSDHVGAFNIAKASAAEKEDGGSIVFYCPNGVTSFKFNYLRSGSVYYKVEKSLDGKNYTTVATVSKASAGVATKDYSSNVRDTESTSPVWIKVSNTSTGSLYIFGVLINQLGGSSATLQPSDLKVAKSEETLNIGESTKVTYTTSSTSNVNFSSNNPNIANITADGTLTAMAEGTAIITVSQAKDETYKAGSATMTIKVVDPRATSALALTSDATVALKETETSQITITGAAGDVTYTSSNTAVATVDYTGKITAVAAGSAVITVNDPGNSTTKGTSVIVTVKVTKDMTGKTVVTFDKPTSGKVPVSSEPSIVSFGGTTNYKDGAYGDYAYGVKLESATEIYLTPGSDATVTLVFDVAGKRTYLDGKTITADSKGEYTFSAKGGTTYTLKKQDSVNLYAAIFDFGGTKPDPKPDDDPTKPDDDPTKPDPTPDATLINYQHESAATAGITISGTTAMGSAKIKTNSVTANGIKLANGYTTDNVLNDNYIKLAVDGGFKKGDVVTIAGFFNNSDDTKNSAATLFVKNDSEAGYKVLFNTEKFINGRLVNTDPVEQTYTLEADADELYIGRNGNTSTYIYTLKVERPAATGGSGDVNGDGAVTMADANAVINHVMGKTPAVFNATAADADGNGKIEKADADAIVKTYLGK